MSVNVTFVNEPSSLESFNSNVRRTVNTTFTLPWDRESLQVQRDFLTEPNFNVLVDRVYENYEYSTSRIF